MYLFTVVPPVKRKVEDAQTTSEKSSIKQKKLDENTLVTPPQSPSAQDNVNIYFLLLVCYYIFNKIIFIFF